MRHTGTGTQLERLVLNLDFLEALRQSLRDLESLKVVPVNDPHIVLLKQNLRRQIAQLERETQEYEEMIAA
ncbi:MAG TPA: hypothetical protein VF123_02210 [Candidatus Sulfotelmatobacter sp.]